MVLKGPFLNGTSLAFSRPITAPGMLVFANHPEPLPSFRGEFFASQSSC